MVPSAEKSFDASGQRKAISVATDITSAVSAMGKRGRSSSSIVRLLASGDVGEVQEVARLAGPSYAKMVNERLKPVRNYLQFNANSSRCSTVRIRLDVDEGG
jgi:hypothetical protein